MKPILLIGHDKDERFGLAPEGLSGAGVDVIAHRQPGDLPLLDDVSGIVVFGGEMNVDMIERYPFLADERSYVRKAVDARVPLLGICLGAQMLARAMDRRVYPAGVREIGFNLLHPTADAANDPLLAVFADGDRVFHWHEDTFELPDGSTILATGDQVRLQAFRIGDLAWGTQFHFEVDRPELEYWLGLAGEDGVRAWGKTSEDVLAEADRHMPAQESRAREVFRRFADIVRSITR